MHYVTAKQALLIISPYYYALLPHCKTITIQFLFFSVFFFFLNLGRDLTSVL